MTQKNLIRIKEKGKYGYVDESGNQIIQPIFMDADEFHQGIARVQLDGYWGYLKDDGSWLVEPSLSGASPFSDELARVRKGFFYGFINRKGEWFIEPTLLEATNFENDCVALVKDLNSNCAFISNKGKMITDFSLDPALSCFDSNIYMVDNRILASKGGKYGFLDCEGNWVVEPKYKKAYNYEEGRTFAKPADEEDGDFYDLIDLDGNTILKSLLLMTFNVGFKDGVAVVGVQEENDPEAAYVYRLYGVIDREGNWVIPPVCSDIKQFKNGFAIFSKEGKRGVIDRHGNVIIDNVYDSIEQCDDHFVIKLNKKKGIADITGKVILPPKYEYCYLRKDGFISINGKKGYGLADLNGKVIIKPSLDHTPEFNGEGYAKVESQSKQGWIDQKGVLLGGRLFDEARDFSDGMAAVNSDGLWGFIDDMGNMAVEPQFDEVRNFKNGICPVGISGHWGIISKNGEWLVEPKFDGIKEFDGGIAPAKIFNPKSRASKWGIINETAQYVIEPEFEDIENFKGDYAKAKSNGKWGLVGRDGKWVVEPEFNVIKDFEDGLAIVKKDQLLGLIDEDGKEIIAPKYDRIYDFTDAGVAEVELNHKYGFINRSGEEIVPLQIKEEAYFNTKTRYLWAKVKGKWGYLDSNEARWLIEPKYDGIWEFGYDNSLMMVAQGDKWGVLDCEDNWLVPPISDSEYSVRDLTHGLMHVTSDRKEGYYDVLNSRWALPPIFEKARYADRNLFIVKSDDKFALADAEGNVYDGKWYEDIFHGRGVMWVKDGDKYGIMDNNRTWILTPIFNWVDYSAPLFNRDGIIRVRIGDNRALADTHGQILGGRTYAGMYPYNAGYFTVVDKNKYGLIDTKGNLVIDTKYENTEPFFNGIALVKTSDKKYGYVDINGDWAALPRFDWAESFKPEHGTGIIKYARAQVDGKYGIIDKKGNWIIEPKFERIGHIHAIVAVTENGKAGYIDLSGNWIVPPIYQEAEDFCNGYGKVMNDEYKYLFVDTKGKTYKRIPN